MREIFPDDEIANLARFDVAGKLALKLINETLRTSIKFKKIKTVKKQIERFGGNGDGVQYAALAAVDPRRVYADDQVAPPPKKKETKEISLRHHRAKKIFPMRAAMRRLFERDI